MFRKYCAVKIEPFDFNVIAELTDFNWLFFESGCLA